jgi:hypothetical protein
MAQCEKIEKCPFFNDQMASMPTTAKLMKKQYCMTARENCARYQVASKGIKVPADLYPAQTNRVDQILNAA